MNYTIDTEEIKKKAKAYCEKHDSCSTCPLNEWNSDVCIDNQGNISVRLDRDNTALFDDFVKSFIHFVEEINKE